MSVDIEKEKKTDSNNTFRYIITTNNMIGAR